MDDLHWTNDDGADSGYVWIQECKKVVLTNLPTVTKKTSQTAAPRSTATATFSGTNTQSTPRTARASSQTSSGAISTVTSAVTASASLAPLAPTKETGGEKRGNDYWPTVDSKYRHINSTKRPSFRTTSNPKADLDGKSPAPISAATTAVQGPVETLDLDNDHPKQISSHSLTGQKSLEITTMVVAVAASVIVIAIIFAATAAVFGPCSCSCNRRRRETLGPIPLAFENPLFDTGNCNGADTFYMDVPGTNDSTGKSHDCSVLVNETYVDSSTFFEFEFCTKLEEEV